MEQCILGNPAVPHPDICNDESGVAYIELLLVAFPFILSVIFALLECGNLLQIKQNIVFVTRETALYLYKECSPYQDVASRNICLELVQERMQKMAQQFVTPESEVAVSIYERTGGVTTALAKLPLGTTASGFKSEIAGRIGDPEISLLIEQQERVAIAEVNAIYKPLFTRALGWWIDLGKFNFYETAIY